MNRYLDKYRSMSKPIKATLWFTLTSFLQKGITMISTPIFTRTLSTKQYGIVSNYTAWSSIVGILITLSIANSLFNLFVKYENDREKVITNIILLGFAMILFWNIISLIFVDIFQSLMDLSSTLVRMLFISFFADFTIGVWGISKRYDYEYGSPIIITIITTIFSTFISLGSVVLISPTAVSRLLPGILINSIVAGILIILIFKNVELVLDKKIMSFAVTFSGGLLPHYLSEFVLSTSDKIMITKYAGYKDVAIYSIGYAVAMIITIFINSINSSFTPFEYQAIKNKEYKKLANISTIILLIIGFLLTLLMLFGREIVLIFGGYKYIDSVQLIPPICMGLFFNFMFQLFARVQEFFEQKLTVVIPSILAAILNITLNIIFIPKFGFVAAAYTTFVCYLFFCVIHYLFYLRTLNKFRIEANIYNVKQFMYISIIFIIIGFFIVFFQKYIFFRIIIFILLLIISIVNREKFKLVLQVKK